jgi:hypothetical protein
MKGAFKRDIMTAWEPKGTANCVRTIAESFFRIGVSFEGGVRR